MRLWYRGRNYDSSVKHDILFMQTTSQTIAHNIAQIIAQELNVREQQVTATIAGLSGRWPNVERAPRKAKTTTTTANTGRQYQPGKRK